MKSPRTPKNPQGPKPRNVAARALREGQFQPRVEPNPKTYKRKKKHPAAPDPEEGDG